MQWVAGHDAGCRTKHQFEGCCIMLPGLSRMVMDIMGLHACTQPGRASCLVLRGIASCAVLEDLR